MTGNTSPGVTGGFFFHGMCNVELEHVKSIEISQISRLKSPMKRDTYNVYI